MQSFSTQCDFNDFLENELMFFFFHNYRETCEETDLLLINRFGKVLATIKGYIPPQSAYHYCAMNALVLFYRLLGYTRSIMAGKGDHHISYLMLFVWYQYFPTLAIYALHRFVICTDHQESPFGSWRDIKYLCQFICTYSDKGQEHSFIDDCCDLVNSQLDSDLQMQPVSAIPINSRSISNVAKWIPREHKQFDWLSHKLALHWIYKNKPFILRRATDDSYPAAVSKSKRLYRKKIAGLNKIIDTTQIKQCARNRRDIIPQHVSRYTQMKQPNLVFGYGTDDSEDRASCSRHFKEWLDSPNVVGSNGSIVTPLPIYHYVKLARNLIENASLLSPEDFLYQQNLIDKQWNHVSKSFHSYQCGNSIPILDTMFNLRSDCYYSSIGYAILFAQYSTIGNRVLVVGNTPTWINLDHTGGFVSMVESIHFSISSAYCTNANYSPSFHLIANTIRDAGLSSRNIRNLRLVIFSRFSHLPKHTLFSDYITSIFSEYSLQTPCIVFWNTSKHFGELLPCSIRQKNTILISGFSPFIFNTLKPTLQLYQNTNPFRVMCQVLHHSHFDILEEYVLRLVG